ncbi:hypothetical protein D2V93_17915 [Flagellimonas taeanensis]|uniref:hypothetical protein n=1 Tax=Flavobacteriaceae TaxID=49546 RepID=UPI000E695334|nr:MULTISPECIES: hypothetical protein [Allomuricauda]MDC6386283.1 hypothetical protein [Muricauda sp. SK9]RIV48041.1 hypothetical protein D2V93_17915 [Allomuricauda taeanensis]
MKIQKVTVILGHLILAFLFSCDGGSADIPPEQVDVVPEKVIGSLPVNGEPCSEYEDVTGNNSKVSILFRWSIAQTAKSYELIVYEGAIEVLRKSVTTSETKIELDRGKTFTWQVISKNGTAESVSSTYSFTSPGVPDGNFAPYAADIDIEFNNIVQQMSISWKCNDEDGDTLIYNVKIVQEHTGEVRYESLTETTLEPIQYIPETTYSIEIQAIDPFGNFSVSKVGGETPE